MKLKTILLFTALCSIAMAQDFHGVSIGGTPQIPTIINNAGQAIYGYVIVRHSTTIPHNLLMADGSWIYTTDFSLTHNVFAADRIIYGGGIHPGSEAVPGMLVLGSTSSMFDPITKAEVPMGDATSWEITGVLFADGTFYGEDREFDEMSAKAAMARSYARDMQYLDNREDLLRQDAVSRRAAPREASMKYQPPNRQALAQTILNVRDNEHSLDAMNVALARIAGMADVVKGQ